MERSCCISSYTKAIHAYGPMKKTVIMGIKQTIERIERTAGLKVVKIVDSKSKGSFSLPPLPLNIIYLIRFIYLRLLLVVCGYFLLLQLTNLIHF